MSESNWDIVLFVSFLLLIWCRATYQIIKNILQQTEIRSVIQIQRLLNVNKYKRTMSWPSYWSRPVYSFSAEMCVCLRASRWLCSSSRTMIASSPRVRAARAVKLLRHQTNPGHSWSKYMLLGVLPVGCMRKNKLACSLQLCRLQRSSNRGRFGHIVRYETSADGTHLSLNPPIALGKCFPFLSVPDLTSQIAYYSLLSNPLVIRQNYFRMLHIGQAYY